MIKINKTKINDASEIAEVLNVQFLGKKDKNFCKKYKNTEEKIIKDMKRCEYWVAREGKQIIGAISLFFEDKSCKIDDLAVKQEYQGKGIGTKLVKMAEKIANKRGCNNVWCTSSKDLNASGFYLKLGYDLEKYMKKHFEGRDILYLGKKLGRN